MKFEFIKGWNLNSIRIRNASKDIGYGNIRIEKTLGSENLEDLNY